MTSAADALQQALEQLALRPLRNALGTAVQVLNDSGILRAAPPAGHLTVAPGQTIASAWGNTVFDQSVNCFTSAQDRDAQWAAPQDGAMCFTTDTQTYYQRENGQWRAAARAPTVSGGGLLGGTYDPTRPMRVRMTARSDMSTGVDAKFSIAPPAGTTAVFSVTIQPLSPNANTPPGMTYTILPAESSLSGIRVAAYRHDQAWISSWVSVGWLMYYQSAT